MRSAIPSGELGGSVTAELGAISPKMASSISDTPGARDASHTQLDTPHGREQSLTSLR